jgi:hypothetical protein
MYEGTEKRLCVTNLTTPGSGSNPRRAYGTQHQHVSDLTPGSACNPTTRYASLYFMLAVDDEENELIVLEMIQHYVEILDRRGERGTGLGGLHASWGGHTRRVTSHYLTPSRRLIVVALSLVRKKHTTNRFTGGFHGCVSLENSNLSKKRCTAPVDYDSLRKVLRQRVRAGPHLQLPQSLPHPRRAAYQRRVAGAVKEGHPSSHCRPGRADGGERRLKGLRLQVRDLELAVYVWFGAASTGDSAIAAATIAG